MTKILWIDPGPHVGIASTDTDDGYFAASEATPDELYDCIEKWIAWADIVGAENFIISGSRAKDSNTTIEMIGVLRYLARRDGKKFVTQAPGAHRFASSEMLKRLGWYTKGSDHARSATGHLVKFLAEHHLIDRARLLPSDEEGGANAR